MPIIQRIPIHETITVVIGGQSIVGESQQVGEIVIAERNSDGFRYARLQLDNGKTYLWTGDLVDVDENTSGDPITETQWEVE